MRTKPFILLLGIYLFIQSIMIYMSQTVKDLQDPNHTMVIIDILITGFWIFSVYFLNPYYPKPQLPSNREVHE